VVWIVTTPYATAHFEIFKITYLKYCIAENQLWNRGPYTNRVISDSALYRIGLYRVYSVLHNKRAALPLTLLEN